MQEIAALMSLRNPYAQAAKDHGIPIRIGAPPEITVFELRRV